MKGKKINKSEALIALAVLNELEQEFQQLEEKEKPMLLQFASDLVESL